MLQAVDRKRQEISRAISPEIKSSLGQFLTPAPVASFMASLFSRFDGKEIRLLDAGAGIGSLTFAFLDRWNETKCKSKASLDAYEIDRDLAAHLQENLSQFKRSHTRFEYSVIKKDFIAESLQRTWSAEQKYTHAILNPPYRKIQGDSEHRRMLRAMGIETVNLYSAFVDVAVNSIAKGGELVVIIPRSFCNGPYYKSFRCDLLQKVAIKKIHLFKSRKKAFKDDDVLQENVILHLVKGEPSTKVIISTSTDSSLLDLETFECDIKQIVNPSDKESFIRIPKETKETSLGISTEISCRLADIGLEVSTGPIVDFRAKESLRKMPASGDVPLLYPAHFEGMSIKWPKENIRKPNAIAVNDETKKMLFPHGCYVLVKRFSSKEEKKRICAVLLSSKDTQADLIGFENHVNVFHRKKAGLDEDVALGLTVFLNSTVVDEYFREFNGHTQVNATDLRTLRYPSVEALKSVGRASERKNKLDQEDIDEMVNAIL